VPDGNAPALPTATIQADAPARPRRERPREDSVDRPRRRRERELVATGTSGKAITALVLGILSPLLLLPSVPGAIFGILALRDIGRSNGRLGGNGMAIAGIVLSCISVLVMCPVALLVPAVQNVRSAAQRMKDSNNLKQLALGLINHESANGSFPQAAAYQDANGKPLLSWRVAILPYIGEAQLYSQFRLNEPWDSPNNKALLPLMPKEFDLPGDPNTGTGMTHYQAFVGPGTAFEPRKRGPGGVPGSVVAGSRMIDFTDGTSNTILIAASATPVPWTKPDDMPFDPAGPPPRLGGYLARGANNVALADGSVRSLPQGTPDATIRAAITRNGNDPFLWP
jgi:hypothetical protein